MQFLSNGLNFLLQKCSSLCTQYAVSALLSLKNRRINIKKKTWSSNTTKMSKMVLIFFFHVFINFSKNYILQQFHNNCITIFEFFKWGMFLYWGVKCLSLGHPNFHYCSYLISLTVFLVKISLQFWLNFAVKSQMEGGWTCIWWATSGISFQLVNIHPLWFVSQRIHLNNSCHLMTSLSSFCATGKFDIAQGFSWLKVHTSWPDLW
jgi:hypothetical protein